jgi:hypothetical protein
LSSILSERLEKSPVETISHGVLALASRLWSLSKEESGSFVGAVIDRAMRWAVRCLSDGSKLSGSDTALFRELGKCYRSQSLVYSLTADISSPPRFTDQECKSSFGRTCDCVRGQASSPNPRGHLLVYGVSPKLCSEGAGVVRWPHGIEV